VKASNDRLGKYTWVFSVLLDDWLNDELARFCQMQNCQKTQVVRMALGRFFGRKDYDINSRENWEPPQDGSRTIEAGTRKG
jgi:Na+-transporting NADH:ubiquinone oxidoreductase subunit NqrA